MKASLRRAVLASIFALGGVSAAAHAETCSLNAEAVFAQAAPNVVRIVSFAVDPFDPYWKTRSATGSGFIIDDKGTVVTNYHVVVNTKHISLGFADGSSTAAELIAGDAMLDIAVLKPVDLPGKHGKLDFASEDPPKLGSAVFAIGNPMGLKTSISSGIVSSTGVELPVSTMSWDALYIQTDAPINPGNSGGPLLDACGHVVGMNTLTYPRAEDMGFAIPVKTLKPAVAQLLKDKRIVRPWIGISGQMADSFVQEVMQAPFTEGFLIETVEPGSAADKAGLRGGNFPVRMGFHEYLIGGDIITSVNGQDVTDLGVTAKIVRSLKPGDKIKLTYIRDGEEHTIETKLFERPVLPQDERMLYSTIYDIERRAAMRSEP